MVTEEQLTKQNQETEVTRLKTIETDAVTDFLAEHTEYDSDEGWAKVADEFALYKQPTSRKAFDALLQRIHSDLSGGEREKGKSEARADLHKRKSLSLGGGSQSSGDGKDEQSMDALRKKYPNLSEDQIRSTLTEIDSLYPEETKDKK